jgi:predicted helicase
MTTLTVHERRPHSASVAGGLRPRPHQQRAIDALTEHFGRGESRAQLRMACGTGKTLVGAWLAQRLDGHTVVVFTPSIALVAQTRRAWQTSGLPLRSLAVCSDPNTAAGRAEIGVDGIDPFAGRHDVDGQVTTHAEVIAGFLDGAVDAYSALTVIISTYHSAPVIAEALTLTDRCPVVDLVVADEAHHLAGRTDSRFLPVLGERAIPARRRLFLTATPVVLANLASIDPLDELSGASDQIRSMSDARLVGPVAHTLIVGDSITAGLLADYRVVVTTPADPTPASAGAPERAALASLADVVGKYGVRRILTFHNRVAAARQFADRVAAMGAVNGVPIRGYAVDGAMPDVQRRKVLDALADSKGCITVVASSQCLREGIDVPAVQ